MNWCAALVLLLVLVRSQKPGAKVYAGLQVPFTSYNSVFSYLDGINAAHWLHWLHCSDEWVRYTGCRVGFGQKTEAGCKDGIPTLGSSRSHQTSLLQLLAMGNLALTDRMNFWMFFKQPLTPLPSSFWEIYCEVLQRVGLQVSAQHVVIQRVCCMLSKTFSKEDGPLR